MTHSAHTRPHLRRHICCSLNNAALLRFKSILRQGGQYGGMQHIVMQLQRSDMRGNEPDLRLPVGAMQAGNN